WPTPEERLKSVPKDRGGPGSPPRNRVPPHDLGRQRSKWPNTRVLRCGTEPVYQYSFKAPCACRAAFDCPVTRPKELLSRLAFGLLNTTRLNTLNASARKSSRNFSVKRNVFARLTFSFSPLKPRAFGL